MTRLITLALAALCFWAAVSIILSAGLPQRSQYTGLLIDGTIAAPEIGSFAPPFATTLLDGTPLSLNDLRGTPVIVNFWATWCMPCEVEMPELEGVYQTYKADGLRVVAVNIGEDGAPIAEWVARLQLSFDIALDSDTRIAQLYQLRGQPMTFVIDQQGIVRHVYFGATNYAALVSAIAPLLNKTN